MRLFESPHFDLYFHPTEREAARQAAVLAERWYDKLERIFGRGLERRHKLVLHGTPARFRLALAGVGMLSAGSRGATVGETAVIALPFGASLADTDHVLGHELVHAFQYEAAARARPAFPDLPAWFLEGMAECLSLAPDDSALLAWTRETARRSGRPDLARLGRGPHQAYRAGHAAWRFLIDRFGAGVVSRLMSAPGSLARKLETVLGLSVKEVSDEWRNAVAAPPTRDGDGEGVPGDAIAPPRRRVAVNAVAPSLSPDGRLLVWASPAEPGALWLADASSGVLRRQLLDPASNPRYDSLHVLDSRATWEPNGRLIAVAASRRGRALLLLVDTATGRCERELRLEEPGEISGVAWSPDGGRLAFAGQSGGWTDLYVHDLQAGALRRLTADAFADIQPAWSPDGRSLVFATDRFTTDLAALRSGPLRLAVIEVASGAVRELPGTAGGRNFDPRVLPGGDVLFVGDPDGQPAVYRLSASGHDLDRVTPSGVEVSGPTSLSPAIAAAQGGLFAYAVLNGDRNEIVITRLPSVRGRTFRAAHASNAAR
jgi:hypothetical protein